eukprot:2442394-Alexandrium_andersonii.AAC.1
MRCHSHVAAGVLRVKYWRRTRRLTNTARAPPQGVVLGLTLAGSEADEAPPLGLVEPVRDEPRGVLENAPRAPGGR